MEPPIKILREIYTIIASNYKLNNLIVKIKMNAERVIVIGTHRGCRDGFVSSLVATTYYDLYPPANTSIEYWTFDQSKRTEDIEKMIVYLSEKYSSKTSFELKMFDVSFEVKDIKKLLKFSSNVKIFDHHISSKRDVDLNGHEIPNIDSIFTFDINECGASLAWKFYFTNTSMPKLIEYVKDRDLWRTDAYMSLEVNEWLFVNQPDFTNIQGWKELLTQPAEFFSKIAAEGASLIKFKKTVIKNAMMGSDIRIIDNVKVYVINMPVIQSDVGSYAVEEKDNEGNYKCDYSIIWRYNAPTKEYYISFRSRGDFDVSLIAKKYGGGGHKAAAGCTVKNINDIVGLL